ncbi:LysR family transcriptional regulator (plasmid) [Agrobacterium leguminum]|uniref:LysR family transcriptional regulator n=1 Tax=Agrobacterium leguminum TaxID=2792015 RepID=UPI0030D286A3
MSSGDNLAHSLLPPLASLRAFDAIVRLGSVRLAAERLNLTPSAISHQLRTLESHFGVQLVRRDGRNIALTESGTLYGAAVLNAFNELLRASDVLDSRKRDPLVRVSVTPTFATLAAMPSLQKLGTGASSFLLRLEARNVPVEFEKEPIDAAVQLGTPSVQGVMYHRLFRSRVAPCAAPSLLKRVGSIDTIEELSAVPLIEFGTTPNTWKAWFQARDPEKRSVEPALIADSLLTALQMACAGNGVVLAPFPLVSPMIESGLLEALKSWPAVKINAPDLYFTYRKVDEASTRIKAVHRWLAFIARNLEAQSARLGI